MHKILKGVARNEWAAELLIMVQGCCSSSIYILFPLLALAAAVKGASVGAGDPSGPVIATKFGKVRIMPS